MKFKSLFFAAIAAVISFASCENEGNPDLGKASITISETSMEFEVAGDTKSLTLNATRDWRADNVPAWITLNPASGKASAEGQTITVTADENVGFDRSAEIVFTIGMEKKGLAVSQAGAKGPASSAEIYFNNFDKETAPSKKSGDRTLWPYLDQHDAWMNETGTGAENVTYNWSGMSVRANGNDAKYIKYDNASVVNNLFFGANAYFAVKNIELNGSTNLELSFASEKYSQTLGSIFTNSEFHIWLSADNTKWVEFIDYTFAGGQDGGKWYLATGSMVLPAGTEKLSICFVVDAASAYRIDDLKLVDTGAEGTAVDFNAGVEKDFNDGGTIKGGFVEEGGNEGGENEEPGDATVPESKGQKTVAEFIAAADADNYYELTGTVSGFNATYCSFDLEDASGKIYVYSVLPASKTEWVSKIANGGTITIYGKYLYFEKSSKHEVVDAHIVSYTAPAGGEEGGDEGGEDAPTTPVAANSADLESIPVNQNYVDATSVNGWKLTTCSVDTNGSANSGTAFACIDKDKHAAVMNGRTDKPIGSIESPTIAGGCGVLTFDYAALFNESYGVKFKVEVVQDNVAIKTITVEKADAEKLTKYSWSEDVNVSGDFKLRFTNLSPSNKSGGNKDRFAVWNIAWTSVSE